MTYREHIVLAAMKGTPTNPVGLPPVLADLVGAQAAHETGNFTSRAFLDGNNAFGYSYVPGAKWQAGPGRIADNGLPLAIYRSIEDSTGEIVDWIYRRIKEGLFPVNLKDITTPEQYARLLKKAGYYGDTLANYTEGLKRWFTIVASPAGIGGLFLLLAGIGYFIYRNSRKNTRKKKK